MQDVMESTEVLAASKVSSARKRLAGIVASVASFLCLLIGGGAPAHATTSDPLGGAGQSLITSLLTNFTTYVIPAVSVLIVAVYAWKVIVKVGTRFLNRA